jgi:hypothetical protein
MSWGHGAVQRALLAELRKQQQAIDTMSLLRMICDGDDLTHARAQSGRRALRTLAQEGVVIAQRAAGTLFWRIVVTHREGLLITICATLSFYKDMGLSLGIAG